MKHIVLLGDSIFDNEAWAYDGPDVISHLRAKLPEGWKATLKAIDGSTTYDVEAQAIEIPIDTSLILVSAGGNNVLRYSPILTAPAESFSNVMKEFGEMVEEFQINYRRMLNKILEFKVATVVCTIYNPHFPDKEWQQIITTTLSMFNNCIIEEAIRAKIPILDLRSVCTEDADYTNAIEPSSKGGAKIANAILQFTTIEQFNLFRTEIFV